MEILIETKLIDFEFWAGAKDNAFLLTYEELDLVEDILQDVFETAPTDTQVNDLFWFDFDMVCDWLELSDEDIKERREQECIAG